MAQLEKHYQVTLGRKMLQGLLAEITDGEKKIVLCEPQTYMNASGECVAKLLRWYHAEKDHLMVIYDDIDIIDENDARGARKIIFRDQLYIILNDEWYNASGQKVPNPMK